MKTRAITAVLAFAALGYGLPATADDSLVSFDNGFGVHPVAGIANNAPVLNTVRGVTPGGRPWAIHKLRARVGADGNISVKGEGLVLAGSDNIGTRAGILQVAASLFCGAARFDSPAADISVGGDFEIRGMLSAIPPDPCTSPALLIRNATGGVLGSWFAGGALADPKDD